MLPDARELVLSLSSSVDGASISGVRAIFLDAIRTLSDVLMN
jgi:hypothetical protein